MVRRISMLADLIYTISELDREILMLQREINDKTIPEKLSHLKNEYDCIMYEYRSLNSIAEAKSAAIKNLSERNEALVREVKETETRLYSSSNIKSIEILQHTLDKLNKEIQNNEDSVYLNLEEQEEVNKKIKELKFKLSRISKAYNPVKDEYLRNIKELREAISRLSEKKSSIIAKLDEGVLGEYESIRKTKGYGMSLLRGEICTGCGMSVPCIIISNARNHKELQKCPNCERFLYSKD